MKKSDRPKHVYIVLNPDPERFQINGCFYSEDDAKKYAGESGSVVVQKLAVL